MRTLWQDLGYALRTLGKNPGFTLAAVLTLAVGIGATTIMFSAIDSILIEPYPYKDADRLTQIFIHDPAHPDNPGDGAFSAAVFLDINEQNHVFEGLSGWRGDDVLYSNGQGTEDIPELLVTGNTFEVLGVAPIMGRWLTPADAQPNAPPVFVLSERLWDREFNRDPKLLGTSFVLNGIPSELIGIMPARFFTSGDIYRAIPVTPGAKMSDGRPLYLYARGPLKSGVTLAAAAADLQVIANRVASVYPKDYPPGFTILPMNALDLEIGNFRSMIYALAAAVLMLLLIACSNVANLLLARATVRDREIAVRASLGATRGRLVGQLLVESFVLSGIGCGLGCALAYLGLKALIPLLPVGSGVPTNSVFGLNMRALLFAVATALCTALLCGLMPAVHAVRGELSDRLTGAGKGTGSGHKHGRLRAGLVIAEVAVSVPLLIGTGLMLRTLYQLEHIDLGFDPAKVLVSRFALPKGSYNTPEKRQIFFDQIVERIRALPGVVAAAEDFGNQSTEMTIPGKVHTERWDILVHWCGADYFRTMGIPLLRGRTFSEDDVASARTVAVINERLAHDYFGDEDPIGRTIQFNDHAPPGASFEIIGIAADMKNNGPQLPPMPEAFAPFTFGGNSGDSVLVKTSSDPLGIAKTVQREVWALDPGVALRSESVEDVLERFIYARPKFGLVMFGAFAGMGLVLVIVGVFSVMAYNVSLQTHEIGVRLALGAQQGNIWRMVLRRGAMLIGVGIVIGVTASASLARFMASQIFGVSATDPGTFLLVAAMIAAVGLAACLVPARLAARVDPLVALRYE